MAALDIRETPALREAGGGLQLVQEFLQRSDFADAFSIEVTVDSSKGGIPAVAFGPGNIAQAHQR